MNASGISRMRVVCVFCLTTLTVAAFQPPDIPELPNLDARTDPSSAEAAQSAAASEPAQIAAMDQASQQIPGLTLELDPVTGSPKVIRVSGGFLTSPVAQTASTAAAAVTGGESESSAPSQTDDDVENCRAATRAFVDEYSGLFGHGSDVFDSADTRRAFKTAHNGMATVVWQQKVDDIDVFEAVFAAHATSNGALVRLSSQLLPDPDAAATSGAVDPQERNAPQIDPREAVRVAAASLGEPLEMDWVQLLGDSAEGPARKQRFTAPGMAGEINVQLVWLPMNRHLATLCWDVVLTSQARGEMFRVLVDAQTGDLLIRRCLTEYISQASYRVFTSDSPSPFSPAHPTPSVVQPPLMARTLVSTSALDTNASSLGWISDGVNETLGNNVAAHLDRNADNAPDLPRPTGAPARVFDFSMDLTQSPTTYGDAAVVQLFYWCNWMHDRLYQLGFTEAAGNFQTDNLGRGGLGNDALLADAQDGSGTDNANMSTPPDGSPGRMQMYLFVGPNPDRDGDLDAEVVLHEYTHGLSNRRVGGGVGLSETQSRGMGEGWSDFYSLALLSEVGDDVHGTYPQGGYLTYLLSSGFTQNYYYGIRRYPYSADLQKNPLTFKDIDPAQISSHPGVPRSPIHPFSSGEAAVVHRQGEVWCVTLWEARANLITKHGHAVGNELILQLVTDGMTLSPPNPNFLQARDAILQADLVSTGGQNQHELWSAFAKRGMGFSATSPASSTTSGVQEAFDIPDDLRVFPSTEWTAVGEVGGPFAPSLTTYTLTNTGSNTITWIATKSSLWMDLSHTAGSLTPGGEASSVSASLNAVVNTLPMGVHRDIIWFTNLTSGVGQSRSVTLRVGQIDYFTESFDGGDNDLDFQTLTFTPDGSANFYSVCREAATNFPAAPGGTVVSLSDDSFSQLTLSGTNTVAIYGTRRNVFFIGSNGYITMNSGDTDYTDSLSDHFDLPRVSGLFDDLLPSTRQVTWRQLGDRVAVTFLNVPEFGASNSNNFQIELFYDGVIRITYLQVDAVDGLVGLSEGTGTPVDFLESDLMSYGSCAAPLWVSLPAGASEGDGTLTGQGVVGMVETLSSNLTVTLSSSDETELLVQTNAVILAGQTNALFDLTVVDDAHLDGSQTVVVTAQAAGFGAGMQSTSVADNETATLTLMGTVTAVEGDGFLPFTVGMSDVPTDNILVDLSSSDTTEIQVPSVISIPAGQTSSVFQASIVDDTEIDGVQTAILTAHVSNWTDGNTSLVVMDNEPLTLSVILPAAASEADGNLSGAGEVLLAGTLQSNLTVTLASSDLTEVRVASSVIVTAGQFSVSFDLELIDDPDVDSAQVVTISAMAAGFVTGSGMMTVLDDESPPAPVYLSPPDGATDVSALTAVAWRYPGGISPMVNGDFEDGTLAGWTQIIDANGGWVINDGSYVPPGPEGPMPPRSGSFSILSQQIPPGGTYEFHQDVTVPFGGSPQLRWAQQVRNHASVFDAGQVFRVEIRDLSDSVLAVPFTTQPGDLLLGSWTNLSFDLSAFAGQAVRVAFVQTVTIGYFNVHLDDVEVTGGRAPGAPITSDVYVGTAPTLGPSDLVGATTNTTWMLPQLAPLTTYYWQVIARRVGSTPGPVWQFTTRGVDHFDWSAVSSPQVVGGPIPVTLTARDEFSAVVSNFTGTVRLAGVDAAGDGAFWREDFEDGDFAGWTVGAAAFARAVTNDTTARGNYSLTMIGGDNNHYQGLTHSLSNITPTEVEFYARAASTTSAGGYVVLSTGPSTTQQAVFFYMNDDGYMTLATSGDYRVPYEPNRWYKINLRFDWVGKSLDFHVDDVLAHGGVPFRATSVDYLSRIDLYNYHPTQNWWDEIRFFDADVGTPVAIAPTNSGSFSEGVWAGAVTVQDPATNLILTAEDNQRHRGSSTPFDVLVQNDVVISVHDAPDPISANGFLTNEIAVANSGPSTATGVTVTNYLPDSTPFVTAIASQGICTLVGNRVECALGSLVGGAQATISVVTMPTVAGTITNTVTVGRAEPDGYLGNNTAASTTEVLVPTLAVHDATVAEGDMGVTDMVFNVSLIPAAVQSVSVDFDTFDGSALAGSDYVLASGALVFPAGQTNHLVTVSVFGDTNAEPHEFFTVRLSDPTNAILGAATAVGTIQNDDLPAAQMPFVEDWETGEFESYWGVTGTSTFRSQVTADNDPYAGTYHLTMDSSVDTTYARNEVTLTINLDGWTNVVLSFHGREWGDEANGPPAIPFVGGADFDGIAVSMDSNSWYEVRGLRELGSAYRRYEVDLDTAIQTHSLSYTPVFYVRFNQYDNYAVSTDGIGIDNISITGDILNRPPIADASATPTTVVSPNGTSASVLLDGSLSWDPDGDMLDYRWFEPSRVQLGTGVVAMVSLPAGTHPVDLVVTDGAVEDTNAIVIEVITFVEALERLADGSGQEAELIAALERGMLSVDDTNPLNAMRELKDVQIRVMELIYPSDPALAAELMAFADEIISGLDPGESHEPVRLVAGMEGGVMTLEFKGDPAGLYIIEASTNLVDWQPIGVAHVDEDGNCALDYGPAGQFPCRFYRVVEP